MKKTLSILAFATALTFALPALAQTATSTSPNTSSTISCVASAVNARESALDSGISAQTQAIASAYTTRATALAQAYSLVNPSKIKTAVKVAWSAFNKGVKSTNATWRTTRNNAWAQFKTVVKVCKAPASVIDSANSSSEVIGQ